jgi:hypothetical protein
LHPNLNIQTKISFKQKIAFALRLKSPKLKKSLDLFLEKYCVSNEFKELKKKYFDFEIDSAVEADNARVLVGTITSKWASDITLYSFTDKSLLLTYVVADGKYLIHRDRGFKLC